MLASWKLGIVYLPLFCFDKLRRSSKKYREIIIDSNLERVNYNSIPACLQFYKLVLVVLKIIN